MTSTVAGCRAASCCRRSASRWPSPGGHAAPARVRARAGPVRRRARRHAGMRHDAGQAAVRADRLEDGAARSLLLPGRRLPEGSGVLRRADELEDPQRRRQAGGARHRRLGRTRHSRRIRRAAGAAAAPQRPPPRRGRGGPAWRQGGPRAPRNAAFDGFCWGIDPWDAKKVEAELKKRGLNPIADNHGDFQSFHVKDPDGFDLQISNGNRKNRRQGRRERQDVGAGAVRVHRWKTVWLDHISFEVSNYKETVAFYHALLGWKLGTDEGSQNTCEIGDIGGIIIRRGGGGARRCRAPRRAARVDRSHLVRHHAVRSGCGEGRARQARADGARGYRRPRRHSHGAVQELPHDDAERIRPADQRDDEGEPGRVT